MARQQRIEMVLRSPLGAAWSPQLVRLGLAGVPPGAPLVLLLDGAPTPFQYTGGQRDGGAEVLLRLGFAAGQERTLAFTPAAPAAPATTDLTPVAVPLAGGARLGPLSAPMEIAAPTVTPPAADMAGSGFIADRAGRFTVVAGPLARFAGWPFAGSLRVPESAGPFAAARLTRTNAGPLYDEYCLRYEFAPPHHYTLTLRCYHHEPFVEVAERFALGMGAEWTWTLNPQGLADRILSRESFEGENQPAVEALATARPADVLCRLQMPVLSEYFVPNNRGWFALFDSRHEERGMLGVLGLYGARWEQAVAGMPVVSVAGGTARWQASLAAGARHWLLYAGPLETAWTPERRLVFHRLHAEFNALRLDEHLDLAGDALFDASNWQAPGLLAAGDCHAAARQRAAVLPPLQRAQGAMDAWSAAHGGGHTVTFRALLDPTPANLQAVYDYLMQRFARWVTQFQGWRTGTGDYQKNVIGFSRWLRGMLIAYELLRREGGLTPAQLGRLNAYFVFAARRILDQGRWPHERTALHPDHPESTRDFYAYGGEHKPDRLYWTNSLPNFQSDPLCALAHLSAVFPDHPDAPAWRRLALDDLEHQLDAYCGCSGAWEESMNYVLYTFSYFVITFYALRGKLRVDYFQDARVRRLAAWLCRLVAPRDRRFDAHSWPALGNALLPQDNAEGLLAYAGALAADDPLRAQCLAAYQLMAPQMVLSEHYPTVLAATAPIPERAYALDPAASEVMDEVGVALRHRSRAPDESYLLQKIGFAKDHYEGDETSFNWYAKGVPFCMDYGTYTALAATASAHNLVEVPEEDSLRRGYLANHLFTPAADYTHCEVPVTQKLLWGRVRSFAELDAKDGKIDRNLTPYFYIGDRNPVGPKAWKVRLLLFVKPDYLVLFDRVYGVAEHRYNLHVTASELRRDGALLRATGQFELDLLALVQHPTEFTAELGEFHPGARPARGMDSGELQRQRVARLYNRTDGIYRTVLFAQERRRPVRLEACGEYGVRIITPEYTDVVWLHNEAIATATGAEVDAVAFCGRAGWVRRTAAGAVQAILPDGDALTAFGHRFSGRGPWTYNLDGAERVTVCAGPPRPIAVARE